MSSTPHVPPTADGRHLSVIPLPAPVDPSPRSHAADIATWRFVQQITDAAERLHRATDPVRLWDEVAEAAATVLPATTAVLRWRRHQWQVLSAFPAEAKITILAGGPTGRPGHVRPVPDLPAEEARRLSYPVPSTAGAVGTVLSPSPAVSGRWRSAIDRRWRSIIDTSLECDPDPSPTRLVWLSTGASELDGFQDLGEVFARHAGQAVRVVTARHTLHEAIEAHRHVGQAVGIVMARRGLDADAAFELLRDQLQRCNVRLRVIAAEVVAAAESSTVAGATLTGLPGDRPSGLGPRIRR